MAEYWSAILDAQDWGSFLFVLIDRQQDKPVLAPKLEQRLAANCWHLPMDAMQSACKPVEIIAEIRRRIRDGHVLVQCVCSMAGDSTEPGALINWLNSLQDDFVAGTAQIITYFILHDFPGAGLRQKEFAEAFYGQKDRFPYLYLLSDCAADQSSIPESSIWRALYGELLANNSVLRVLAGGSLYSLGFSTLNANDGELGSLRRHLMSCWFAEQAQQAMKLAEAWTILIGNELPFPGLEPHELRPALRIWLENVTGRLTVFPDADERKNNRILAGLNHKPHEEARAYIGRFYQINGYNMNADKETAKQFAIVHLQNVILRLSRTVNVPAFPSQLLERVTQELNALAEEKPELLMPPWEDRKFLLPHSRAKYLDQYLGLVEKAYERAIRSRQITYCAGALAEKLGNIRSFIEEAGSLGSVLKKELLPDHIYETFAIKYGKYAEHMQDAILRLPDHPKPVGPEESFFEVAGAPVAVTFHAAIESSAEKLRECLPGEIEGKFCQTVCWEYGTQERLHDFFNMYLAQSKRMFFEPADAPDDPHSLYYTDKELAAHPWFMDKTVIEAGNDNVERVDLFRLKYGLEWLLKNSRCFQSADDVVEGMSGLKRVFDLNESGTQSAWETISSNTRSQAADSPTAAASVPDHNLAIHTNGKQYVLIWDWDTTSPNALVRISQDGNITATINCSAEQYYSPVGDNPNGIDITSGLKHGGITVEIISSNRRLYARKEMAGRKNTVKYQLDRAKGGAVLTVQCSSSDLKVLALCAPRSEEGDKKIFYPLGEKGGGPDYRFEGLKLGDLSRCSLGPSPEERFPTVDTVRT